MESPPDTRRRGLVYILGGMAVAGVCGYLIQLAAPALLKDAHAYLAFSVFWSTLYLFGSAVSGIQQEVTRATHPSVGDAGPTRLRTVTIGAVGILAVLTVVVGLALSTGAFSPAPVEMTFWFGIGIIGYLLLSVLAGMLYGLEMWGSIAAVTVADALIRAALVLVGLALGLPPGVLAAFIAIPFGLAVAIVWLAIRRRVVGKYMLDVGPRRLSLNALSTVLGAAAMGVLVTGLPLLLRTTMPTADATSLASLVLVITVTRAPLIIPLMALQSYLIVGFRRGGVHIWGVLSRYLMLLAAATAIFAVAAWLWGPALVDFISDGRLVVDAPTAAVVMISAGLVAAMCVTGPALLAESQHRWFVAGWVTAAATTIVLLAVPLPYEVRTPLALLVAPTLGALVHILRLVQSRAGGLANEA